MKPSEVSLSKDGLNYLVTNRIPRVAATLAMGWLSHIDNKWIAKTLITAWRLVSDLDLSESAKRDFKSLHDCFTRELRPGSRTFTASETSIASPSDGYVVGAGRLRAGQMMQAKGQYFELKDLLGDGEHSQPFIDGHYVTLRLSATMYHRFHAPADLDLTEVRYFSGDVWNVNPPTLARIPRLYCKNERAMLRCNLRDGTPLAIVPVAAILVASIRLHALPERLHLRYKGANPLSCQATYSCGDELGWFEHGSTIIVFTPPGFDIDGAITLGTRVNAGEPLFRRAIQAKYTD